MKLYGYEHHATVRDVMQIGGWRVQDARMRIVKLLNAVSPPTPQQNVNTTPSEF